MAQLHEWMFYELMWRLHANRVPYPFPWWVQQAFRRWTDSFDAGLFDSKEAAFASNAHYRYWNLIGEPNQDLESLVGQAGEIEPVYDQYTLSFFVFDADAGTVHLPQLAGTDGRPSTLQQCLLDGWLPAVETTYDTGTGIRVRQLAFGTPIARTDPRGFVLVRLSMTSTRPGPANVWLCASVNPAGPTGFQRHDRAGRFLAARRLNTLRYIPAERRIEVNATWGPSFDDAPAEFGMYGNGASHDPTHYVMFNPWIDFTTRHRLNGFAESQDHIAGLCHGVVAWPAALAAGGTMSVSIRLPVNNLVTTNDLREMSATPAATLENWLRASWAFDLFDSGFRIELPPGLERFVDQDAVCRSQLLILADGGAIHPGPTIYDSFWIRDSSVEGIACALVGQETVAEAQFGTHYPRAFQSGPGAIGPVARHGFFGREHEQADHEWDSNGQALWAIGRFDRIMGRPFGFGQGMFTPYVLDGARWLRDNRSAFGLLHSGWSAEHVGDKGKPHYWDDLWACAGLWEAAQLAARIGAPAAQQRELWHIYDDVRDATRDSMRWVLTEQRRQGHWETFIPTGPADVGRLDSTMIGAVAYFHPCRLHMGSRLGDDIDRAMRHTLETVWSHFVRGGFRHDAAWSCFGPYLTLQLAHAFLYVGDVGRAHQLLWWTLENAGFARVSRGAAASDRWDVVLGCWNEQHCYPVASDFAEFPGGAWYMGDIPHGWACAEYILLLRDILFFEADEDADRHMYLLPGVAPEWFGSGRIRVQNGRTMFGSSIDFEARHDPMARRIDVQIHRPPASDVRYVFTVPFGAGASSATADGRSVATAGRQVYLPAGTRSASISYQ